MPPAEEIFRVDVDESEGNAGRTVLATIRELLWSFGSRESRATAEVIVSRRDTFEVITRLSVGSTEEGDRVASRIRHDLAEMSETDFLREWRSR